MQKSECMQDIRNFRKCLAQFATGVTVVTCAGKIGENYGVTANSFSSVSLDPPLVLWNIAKNSKSVQGYLKAEYFAINILAKDQEALSQTFAQSKTDLFNDIDHYPGKYGAPLLEGAIASLECRMHTIHDCGDHYIIIGEVIDYYVKKGEPLVFFDGQYCKVDHAKELAPPV